MTISFGSDNHSGVHKNILEALAKANVGYEPAYGDDSYTLKAREIFKREFGESAEPYFVFNGTGANVLSIMAMTQPFNAVICARTAHINTDECGAPERMLSCKLLECETIDGKLTIEHIKHHLHDIGFQHHVQPKVVSVTESTELGTIYTPQELKSLANYAHSNGLYFHIDGSRLANAAAALNCNLRDISTNVGADIISFGGTKNGLMMAEAVVILNPELNKDFLYKRKQSMQLFSKSRFIAAQYIEYFNNELWRKNAQNANQMAQYLAEEVAKIPYVKLTQKVQVNSVFAIIPQEICDKLLQKHFFYIWDEATCEVRWMCSFDTRKEYIDAFVKDLKEFA